MQKHYYEIIINQSVYQELISKMDLSKSFNLMGIEEFSMEENEVDDLLGERSYSGGDLPESVLDEVVSFQDSQAKDVVKIYIESEEETKSFCEEIKRLINIELNYTKKEIQDWNESWKKDFQPIEINSKNVLIPSWYDSANFSHENKVKIYPGMGFGTGSHETTFLCLKLLVEELDVQSFETCMDYGCGSGILAIYLNCLKEQKTTDYYDIDQDALDNCKVNLDLNKIKSQSNLYLPKDQNKFLESYDLVFANILQNVLLSEKDRIQGISSRYLIISGLLNDQEGEVINSYSEMKLLKVLRKNDWCALLMERA